MGQKKGVKQGCKVRFLFIYTLAKDILKMKQEYNFIYNIIKTIKSLGINLTKKEQDLYTENYIVERNQSSK